MFPNKRAVRCQRRLASCCHIKRPQAIDFCQVVGKTALLRYVHVRWLKHCFIMVLVYKQYLVSNCLLSGADPGFQVRGSTLKIIAPSAGRHENFRGILCEKSWFYAKKIIFFPMLGGAHAGCTPPPLGSAPDYNRQVLKRYCIIDKTYNTIW